MYLYIIRHGDPDYENDDLTELGLRQAELTAGRLCISGIDAIYSSPYGRARHTARFLAERLSLPVTVLEWARELGPDCRTPFPDGTLKGIGILPSAYLHGKEILSMDEESFFKTVPGICDNALYDRYREIGEGLDALLSENGFARTPEGFYRTVSGRTEPSFHPCESSGTQVSGNVPCERHIALFCHGAMIRSVISHLLHIPYACIGSSFHENPCGITVFRFHQPTEAPIVPELISFGDVGHLYADGKPQHFYLTGEPF